MRRHWQTRIRICSLDRQYTLVRLAQTRAGAIKQFLPPKAGMIDSSTTTIIALTNRKPAYLGTLTIYLDR